MRVRRFGWVLRSVASVASVALVGCFTSSNSPPGETPTDGGAEPIDATSPEAAAPTPDASDVDAVASAGTDSGVDAGSDATEEPGPAAPVTVVVTGPGGAESGKTIVFSDATGATLAMATTNAAGTVVQVLAAGGQVTALLGTSDAPQLVTVVGVQPGDTLTAVDGALAAPDVEASVSFPAFGGAESYLLYAGNCSTFVPAGASPSADLDVTGCTSGAGQFPLLALARDDSGTTLGFTFLKSAMATGGQADVTMSGAYATPGTETVSLSGLGALDYPYVTYSEVTSGVPYSQTNLSPASPDAGLASAVFDTHPGYADFVQTEFSIQQSQTSHASTMAIATRGTPATSGSSAYDESDLLPAITGTSLDATDPTRPTVSWTSAASLTAAAGTIAAMTWYDAQDGGAGQFGTWIVVAPSSASTAQVPALPAAVAAGLAPGTGATWDGTPTVVSVVGPGLADYAALRATAGAIGAQLVPTSPPMIPPLVAAGTMKVTMSYAISDE